MLKPVFKDVDFQKLKDVWLHNFHTGPIDPPNGTSGRWLDAVLQVLKNRGDELFTRELRQAEERFLDGPFKDDYLDALYTVVGNDVKSLVLASPEQRIKAIKLAEHNTAGGSGAKAKLTLL